MAAGAVRLNRQNDTRSIRFGTSSLSLGVGGRILPKLWLGGRLSGGGGAGSTRAPDGGRWRSSSLALNLSPYLEVRPLPELRVQPYVMVEGTVGYGVTRMELTSNSTNRSINVGGGGRVGMHAFLVPRVSLDADIGAWFSHRRIVDAPAFTSSRAVGLSARVGLSVWW